jgi:hypothetical protein
LATVLTYRIGGNASSIFYHNNARAMMKHPLRYRKYFRRSAAFPLEFRFSAEDNGPPLWRFHSRKTDVNQACPQAYHSSKAHSPEVGAF